jgi:cell division protein FtsW
MKRQNFICGMTISMRAREPFARLFGFGITLLVCLQAMINIGVVTGVLPTKGIALPFISYGGSSLVMSIVMTAVLLNIAQVESEEGEAQLAPRRGEGDDIA